MHETQDHCWLSGAKLHCEPWLELFKGSVSMISDWMRLVRIVLTLCFETEGRQEIADFC